MPSKLELIAATNGQETRTLKYGAITIQGNSRAAVQTYWRIPEYRLGFDMGWLPWEFMGTPNWFFTHTHMDHILALPAYVARRRMMGMELPNIYVPNEYVALVKQVLYDFSRLDRGALPCNIIGMQPGDKIYLTRDLFVSAFETFHTIASLGYIVWEQRQKLKTEFLNLTDKQICALKAEGTQITDEFTYPRLAYLGDSTCKGLDRNPDTYRADVLITEMTFVAPGHQREAIHKNGHIHLDELIERRDKFENKLIIASHFSSRYVDQQIKKIVQNKIPDMFNDRLVLWL